MCTRVFVAGERPVLDDLRELDEALYSSLQWILNNDISDVIYETFSVLQDEFGVKKEVELVQGRVNRKYCNSGLFISQIRVCCRVQRWQRYSSL